MRLIYRTANASKNPEQTEELIKLAIKKGLYQHKSWMLYSYLMDRYINSIVIGFALENGIRVPVGVAIVTSKSPVGVTLISKVGRVVMVYVKENYRRQKVGTKLLSKLDLPRNPILLSGINGSRDFYTKAIK